VIGIEPTGHYWLNLAYFLRDHGIPLVIVNPMHVKKSKELDDNSPTKNDRKDARTIAKLVKDGRFAYPRVLEGKEADLRIGVQLCEQLIEERNTIQNRIHRFTDRYFLEFWTVFLSLGKMALAVLEKTPFPHDIQGREVEELLEVWRTCSDLKSPQLPKAIRLQQVAQTSIGITEGQQMARYEIATLLSRYRQLTVELEKLTEELEGLVKMFVEYEWLSTIPGLGTLTIAELLSETGSFSHYQDPRQIIKLAGLNVREFSSGKHQGKKGISKRGRRRLRSILFRAMIPMVRHNEAFRAMHEYYTTRTENPLRKKQSLVVLCGKLIRILYTFGTKLKSFCPKRMMNDIPTLAM
jgi:transposase